MSKYTVDKFLISDEKVNSSFRKKYVGFADLHCSSLSTLYFNDEKIKRLVSELKKFEGKVEAFLAPGDFLLCKDKFLNTKFYSQLRDTLQRISEIAPIILSKGNHDFPLTRSEEEMKEEKKRGNDLFSRLDTIDGVYPLDNQQVTLNGVCYTGFSPRRDSYNTMRFPNDDIPKSLEEFKKCNFKFSKDCINVLLVHDHRLMTYPEVRQKLGEVFKNVTLLIGAHLHDGYVPIYLQKLMRNIISDWGIWEKVPNPFMNMCRGAYQVSEGNISSVILPDWNDFIKIALETEETACVVLRGVAKYSWVLPATLSYTEIEIQGNKSRKKEL